jgi:hypothetical protein
MLLASVSWPTRALPLKTLVALLLKRSEGVGCGVLVAMLVVCMAVSVGVPVPIPMSLSRRECWFPVLSLVTNPPPLPPGH